MDINSLQHLSSAYYTMLFKLVRQVSQYWANCSHSRGKTSDSVS